MSSKNNLIYEILLKHLKNSVVKIKINSVNGQIFNNINIRNFLSVIFASLSLIMFCFSICKAH